MICYVSMKTFRDMKDRKSEKTADSAVYQHFISVFSDFGPSYLEKFSSKHSIPYHFLNRLFELFATVLFIFQFEQLGKLVFSAYKEFDRNILKKESQQAKMCSKTLPPDQLCFVDSIYMTVPNFMFSAKFEQYLCFMVLICSTI